MTIPTLQVHQRPPTTSTSTTQPRRKIEEHKTHPDAHLVQILESHCPHPNAAIRQVHVPESMQCYEARKKLSLKKT